MFVRFLSQDEWKLMKAVDYLVSDDKDLCQLAYERGSLTKLANLVKSITPSEASGEWDEDEPDSMSSLRAVRVVVSRQSTTSTEIYYRQPLLQSPLFPSSTPTSAIN